MATNTTAEDRARQLLDARMNSVRALVGAQSTIDALRAQVSEAEREHARLYGNALNDGWTAAELKQIGLAEPDKITRVKRRQARTGNAASRPKTTTGQAAADESEPIDGAHESRPPQPES